MIKIIGIGGCGNNILEFIKKQDFTNIENDYEFISVKNETDVDNLEYEAEDKIFTIAGFGGNTAGKLTIDLTKKILDKHYQVKNLIIFPFSYETRTQQAIHAIEELSSIHRNIEIFPNDILSSKDNQDKTMAELMKIYDSKIFDTIMIHDKRQFYRSFIVSAKKDDKAYTAIVHFWSKDIQVTLLEPEFKVLDSSHMPFMAPSKFAFKNEDKSTSGIQDVEEIANKFLNSYITQGKS